MQLDTIITGDSAEVLKTFPDACIDLIVTSPPYDNLRTYKGFTFDFETIAKQLYRVTKTGGVVVWVVGDATVKGSETGTSFRQALYFMQCGFNLHDTMIYRKINPIPLTHNRYEQEFEYMFVFSKGKPKATNIQRVETKNCGKSVSRKRTSREYQNDSVRFRDEITVIKTTKQKGNIWEYSIGSKYDNSNTHPAIFPEALAHDHIISWSNEGDTVLDCFCGSGTTPKMAKLSNRHYIGIETSAEYVSIANQRIGDI